MSMLHAYNCVYEHFSDSFSVASVAPHHIILTVTLCQTCVSMHILAGQVNLDGDITQVPDLFLVSCRSSSMFELSAAEVL